MSLPFPAINKSSTETIICNVFSSFGRLKRHKLAVFCTKLRFVFNESPILMLLQALAPYFKTENGFI